MKKFLLLCFSFVIAVTVAWAQERTVTGKVTSAEDGTALPGVNVIVKGTTNGTVSDTDGNFRLSVPASGSVLVFSFIGLQSTEVAVGDKSVVDVSMALDVQQLSEVVVTGTGVATEKRKLAIAVETVAADKLPAAPTASVDQALVGKIAGAQISTVSGTPGAQVQILLRGINTIQRGTAPMIMVDGIQLFNTSLNTLDLSSVERVEVIQGAAAATLYGAQGANGVIQIFTKKGQAGQLNIDFSASVATNEYLNVGGLKKADHHAFVTDASGNVIAPATGDILAQDPHTLQWNGSIGYDPLNVNSNANKPYDKNLKYYDHFKQMFVKAPTTNANMRISGGQGKTDFAIAISNNRQEATIRDGGYYDRTNFTANIGTELAKGLTFRTITQLAYSKNTTNSYIYGMFNARPFVDLSQTNDEGYYSANTGGAAGVNAFNPYFISNYTSDNIKTIDVIQNFNLNYKFPKFVELDTRYGLNYQRKEEIYSIANQSLNRTGIDETGSAFGGYWSGFVDDYTGEIQNFSDNHTFQNWVSKATLNFDFAKDFGMSAPIKTSTMVLFDWRKNVDTYYTTYSQGLPTYSPFTAANAANFRTVGGYRAANTPYTGTVPFITYGYLVNQSIDFGDVAGVSGGFRSDYSSAFGRGSKPFTFPRASGFFRLSGLDFWDNSGVSRVLLEAKLRAAYGEAGIQPYAFDRQQTLTAQVIGASSAFRLPTTFNNADLSVEVSKEIEIGTDLVFSVLDETPWLNNINLSATYWKRSSEGVIYDVDVAPSTGIGKLKTNAFGIGSRGIQISLNTQAYKGSNFQWNLTTNFGKQTSEIESVQGNGEIVVLSSAGSTNYVLKAGNKIGQLIGFLGLHDVNAINPNTGNPYIATANQGNYVVASNGWVVNRTTKQPYFTPQLYPFGDPNPKFNISFINDFKFKSFLNFGFQIDWVQGSHLYNQTKEWMYRDGIHSDYTKPISIDGAEAGAWTAFYRGVYAVNQANGTKNYFYEDASFVRLRNVNVALDFDKLFDIPGFKRLQIVLTARNIWTGTKYTGLDPEISSGTLNSAWDRGTDHNSMPNLKTYQVGLNVGF